MRHFGRRDGLVLFCGGVVLAVLFLVNVPGQTLESCRLDWNGDGQINLDDYLVGDPMAGYYAEWYIHMYHRDLYPSLFPGADSSRLDYNGDGLIDQADLMGPLDETQPSEGYYVEWYIYSYYPQHYPIFMPEYDCLNPQVDERMSSLEPVVLRGADVPGLHGVAPEVVRAYRYDGGQFVPIRFQVDERVNRTIDASNMSGPPMESPELSYVYSTWGDKHSQPGVSQEVSDDGLPGAIDDDDELVFLLGEAGQRNTGDWVPDADPVRFDVELQSPLTGARSFVYLFTFETNPPPATTFADVSYTRNAVDENTSITTDHYGVHYAGRWSLDEIRYAGGPDLIDRIQGRAFHFGGETEQLWDQASTYLGDLTGPVRAIREIQGAASGVTTTYIAEFFQDRIVLTTYLRVHALSGIWLYMDYDSANGNMTYEDDLTSGVTIDGAPEGELYTQPTRQWAQVASVNGSLTHLYQLLDTSPLLGREATELFSYYRDDRLFAADTGDDLGAFGQHGFHIDEFCRPGEGSLPVCHTLDEVYTHACCEYYYNPDNPSQKSSVGSYYVPFVTQQVMIPGPSTPMLGGGAYRERFDNPLDISVVEQTRL